MTALGAGLAFAALLFGLVLLRLRAEGRRARNAATDDHLVEQPGWETGHSSVYRVTKDPQAYARIFSPRRPRK